MCVCPLFFLGGENVGAKPHDFFPMTNPLYVTQQHGNRGLMSGDGETCGGDDDAQNPLYAESNCVFLGNSPNWSCVRPVIKTGDC